MYTIIFHDKSTGSSRSRTEAVKAKIHGVCVVALYGEGNDRQHFHSNTILRTPPSGGLHQIFVCAGGYRGGRVIRIGHFNERKKDCLGLCTCGIHE